MSKSGVSEDSLEHWQAMATNLAKLGLAAHLARQFGDSHRRHMTPDQLVEMGELNARFESIYEKQWQTLVRKIRGISAQEQERTISTRKKTAVA